MARTSGAHAPVRSKTGAGEKQSAPDETPAKAPTTRRGRDTRDKLLVAARDIFSRTAFADVRVLDISRAAGVAAGTFYTYFDSKEQIFRVIAARVLREMSDSPRRTTNEPKLGIAEGIEEATRRYFECVHRNARIARSIEEIQAREEGVGESRHEMLVLGVRRIERWIVKLQEKGICRAEIDAWPTAVALHAMNVSVAYDHLVHRDAPEETEVLLKATMQIWYSTLGLER